MFILVQSQDMYSMYPAIYLCRQIFACMYFNKSQSTICLYLFIEPNMHETTLYYRAPVKEITVDNSIIVVELTT